MIFIVSLYKTNQMLQKLRRKRKKFRHHWASFKTCSHTYFSPQTIFFLDSSSSTCRKLFFAQYWQRLLRIRRKIFLPFYLPKRKSHRNRLNFEKFSTHLQASGWFCFFSLNFLGRKVDESKALTKFRENLVEWIINFIHSHFIVQKGTEHVVLALNASLCSCGYKKLEDC